MYVCEVEVLGEMRGKEREKEEKEGISGNGLGAKRGREKRKCKERI